MHPSVHRLVYNHIEKIKSPVKYAFGFPFRGGKLCFSCIFLKLHTGRHTLVRLGLSVGAERNMAATPQC